MSKITVNNELLRHLCDLSMLNIENEDFFKFREQLQKILDYMAMLDEVNTAEVNPLFGGIEFPPITRMDIPQDSLIRSDVVANAPDEKEGLFVIPKVIE